MLEDSHPLSMTCKPRGKETEAGKKFFQGIEDKIIKKIIHSKTFATLENFECKKCSKGTRLKRQNRNFVAAVQHLFKIQPKGAMLNVATILINEGHLEAFKKIKN